jgi:hypothetical protein
VVEEVVVDLLIMEELVELVEEQMVKMVQVQVPMMHLLV